MEEALFQDTNGILYRTLVLGLPDLGWKNDRMVVLGPFSVILVQFRSYPVPVGNDSLLAIVADDQRRYAAKIRQSIVVDGNPLRLLGGDHPFGINVLGIRKDGYKNHNLHGLPGEWIHHAEGLSGEIHFHLLANDGVEMQRLLLQ